MKTRTSMYAWAVVVLLLVVWMLNYLDRQLIFSIFPLLQADLHLSSLQLGLLGTAFLWVYALCSPLAGHLADRVGRKRLICGSLFVWSLLTLLTARAGSYGHLVALRALMGVSEACYLPAGLALIAAYHSSKTRSRAISLHYSGTYIGTVLGGVLGGALGAKVGWRPVFAAFGVVGCVYAASLLFALKEKEGASDREGLLARSEESFTVAAEQVLRSSGYVSILAVFAAASICDWAMYTWMPLYLYETFHFTLAKAGFTATFYMKIGGFLGLLLGGTLADAWAQRAPRGRAWTQASGLLLAAPFLIVGGLTHTPAVLYGALLIFGIGKGAYDGNTMPLLCERVSPKLRATAFGFLNFAGTFAGGVIAATAGALKSRLGLGHTFSACGLVLFCAGVLLLRVRNPERESA